MDKITLLKNFASLSYTQLEQNNLAAKQKQIERVSEKKLKNEYQDILAKEKGIKAVTLCFSDIEGRLHMLDYDKSYFLTSTDNLTFDGSSVRGLNPLAESDCRLKPDWSSFRWLPADLFGAGKVLLFANIMDQQGQPHTADMRSKLQQFSTKLYESEGIEAVGAPEIEGVLVKGVDAEQHFVETLGFELISTGGYYHSLPADELRQFIDDCAEAQRALGFQNEKDHPEVAPSQFELNFRYGPVVAIADQIQLYKLICRQVATNNGMTATFLPKPIGDINGNGMHINFSLRKKSKNLFYDRGGENNLSSLAEEYISKILNHAPELCLIFNSSVNSYRRLDPKFEAPNQIKVSPTDRGAMIRLPLGNKHTTRIEVRSVAPDANPYLVFYALLRTAEEGDLLKVNKSKRTRVRYLPSTIVDAIRVLKSSDLISSIMEEEVKQKYIDAKEAVANRSPKELGDKVKRGEVIFHHEVTNQVLWNQF